MTVANLDLDWDIIQHLAVFDSVKILKAEISEGLIEDPLALEVFQWQMDHVEKYGKPANASVIEAQFGAVAIDEPQTVVGDLIDRLRDRFGRNQGQEAILRLTKATIHDPQAVASEMLSEGQRLFRALGHRGDFYSNEDHDKALEKYRQRVLKGRGPSLGFPEVDGHFYGQLGLTFLVGAPKSLKSWYTIKSVLENIRNDKFPYLFSLELPAEESDMRLRCMNSDIPYWKYLQGALDQQDLQDLKESGEILAEKTPYEITKPSQGKRNVHDLVSAAKNAGSDAVYIDQLQYVETRRGIAVGATNDTKDYFEVINDFRDASDEIPIWIVHQFNRSILNSESMPDMQQIKGSSAVEECSTLVLGLWSSKEMRKSQVVNLGTLASRNYSHKTWEIQAGMRTRCNLKLIGEVND